MEAIIARIFLYSFLLFIFISITYALVSAFNPRYKTKSTYKLERFVEVFTAITIGKVGKFMEQKFPILVKKWGEDVVRAIAKLIAFIVSIYLIFHEFPELRDNINFVSALILWAMYALLVFFYDTHNARKQSQGDKIDYLVTKMNNIDIIVKKMDELINEIRQERNERNQSKQSNDD